MECGVVGDELPEGWESKYGLTPEEIMAILIGKDLDVTRDPISHRDKDLNELQLSVWKKTGANTTRPGYRIWSAALAYCNHKQHRRNQQKESRAASA